MGHLFFILLHFIAIGMGFAGLLITIPLHMFYANSSSRTEEVKKQTKIMQNMAKQDSSTDSFVCNCIEEFGKKRRFCQNYYDCKKNTI